MKKAQLSPVTSFAVSCSLVLGILVSDVCGARFLTAARAKNDSCQERGKKVSSKHLKINNGLALGGLAVRGVIVNGSVVHHGVIASSVVINDMLTPGVKGVLVGDGSAAPDPARSGAASVCRNGVLVGDGAPVATTGVLVGDGAPVSIAGVLVGDGAPVSIAGVLVGDGSPTSETVINAESINISGALVSIGGTAKGGVLVGDGIAVVDGVITGQNLRLIGASVKGGHISVLGSAEVQISPAN